MVEPGAMARSLSPSWDSAWNRPLAFAELLLQPLALPLALVMWGVVEFRRGQLSHVRFLVKTLVTGHTGPSRGVTW